ncbi:uridine phosphorylase 1 isoform X8 [Taeniopygia guttata]|uniref:uridine phosphorylase 1 isoform X8 n=1 Tax=Taeniopygia guttata TaxID=59729 RepID=UPI003BB95D78
MDFVLVSAGMELLSRGKVRAGGRSGRTSSPFWEEGVPARLPQFPEPGTRRESPPLRSAANNTPTKLRRRAVPRAELSRSAPDGVRLRPRLPFGLRPAHFPGGTGQLSENRALVSEQPPRRQRGRRAPSAGERRGTEPLGRRQGRGWFLCVPSPGSRSALGWFLELSLGTASACVCQERLSELLPGSGVLTPTERHQLPLESLRSAIPDFWLPLKQPEKSPSPSQILGLSDLSRAPHEMPLSGCHRKWIKETDSASVRLAKQGGRPDLLKHYTPVVMKSPPAAPDWYSHCANLAGIEKPR